jgi:hypothetical protein
MLSQNEDVRRRRFDGEDARRAVLRAEERQAPEMRADIPDLENPPIAGEG